MSKAVANLTQSTETITFSAQDNGETISVNITEAARGPAGAAGAAGPNSVTSATTSDGTANLSLSNVTTATAEVTGTLTANHIHGNLAGSVYAHVRAGENLAKGDPVYISGSHGSGSTLIAIVSKADASDPLKMPAVGVMDAAVTANANGHMVITGTISDINTATYSVNAELYVAEGGGFTATAPLTYAQPVARVERSNTNNGAVIVKVNGLSAYDNTGNTLVRRNANGDSVFSALSFPSVGVGATELGVNNDGSIESNPSVVLPGASGTLALTSNLSGVVSIAYGGTNATTASSARTNLGLGTTDAPTFSNVSLASGTITTSQPLSLTQTWNAAGVTFKGIDINVTDTASASGSLLMDLRVGGISRAYVNKSGYFFCSSSGSSATPSLLIGATNTGFSNAAGQLTIINGGTACAAFVGGSMKCTSYGLTSDVGSAGTTVFIHRDANDTIAQRNGANAQESRVYGTYTSATNFERLNLKYNGTATAFQIGTEKGSTGGTARPLEFQTDGTTRMTLTTGGDLNLSASSASVVYGISITNSSSSSIASSRITVKNDQNKGGSFGIYSSTFGFGLANNAGFGAENSVIIYSDSNVNSGGTGSIQFRAGGYNANQERFRIISTGAVTFGGTTSSFPALKPSSAILQARLADDSAYTTIDAQLRAQGTAPASATAAGTSGDIRYDADYIYICTATNTWKRAAIATWP